MHIIIIALTKFYKCNYKLVGKFSNHKSFLNNIKLIRYDELNYYQPNYY